MNHPAIDAILRRRTVRDFRPDPVPYELLELVVRAACNAPTSGNLQPWEFYRVVTPSVRERLVAATFGGYSRTAPSQAWLADAPELLVVCCDPVRTTARYGEDGPRYARLDVAAAIENMLVAATALGLGSAWVGGFREAEVRQALGLDPDLEPVGIVAIGYPRTEPPAPYRLPVADVLREV